MRKLQFFLITILTLSIASSCTSDKEEEEKGSLTKRTAKFITKKSAEAVEGVSEALQEDGAKLGEAVAGASGEVLSGTAKGLSDVADEKGVEIGRNLGNITGKTLTGLVQGLGDNLGDTELIIPPASSENAIVLSVTKMLHQADSINAYILFKTKGTYDLSLTLQDVNSNTLDEANKSVTIKFDKPAFLSMNFGFGDAEGVQKAKRMKLEVKGN